MCTEESSGLAGKVSIGFMHATPGDMKSFRSSAESIALMLCSLGGGGWQSENIVVLEVNSQRKAKHCAKMRRLS